MALVNQLAMDWAALVGPPTCSILGGSAFAPVTGA